MGKIEWYRKIYIKDGYRCVYCGRDMLADFDTWWSMQVDHVIPESKDGDDSITYRVTSCTVCNKIKLAFVPEGYAEMEQEKLLEKIRSYILEKRAEFQSGFYPAIEEFRRSQAQQEED